MWVINYTKPTGLGFLCLEEAFNWCWVFDLNDLKIVPTGF